MDLTETRHFGDITFRQNLGRLDTKELNEDRLAAIEFFGLKKKKLSS